MFYSMHAQLPSLRELTLTIICPKDWLNAEDVHKELGGFTQLTRLCLTVDDMEVSSCNAASQQQAGHMDFQNLAGRVLRG